MADASMIGKEFPSYTFTVERGKIREFVQAIGDSNPVYTDSAAAQAAGYRDVIAPPTFATVVENWGGSGFFGMCEDLDINPVMVLHGEQEYEYAQPIYPGEVVTASPRIVNVAVRQGSKGKMTLIVMESTFRNQQGETLAIARSTIIERS